MTNPAGEAELCRFAIIGHGDSWESIHQEIGHRADVYMPGAVTGEKLAAAVASADIWHFEVRIGDDRGNMLKISPYYAILPNFSTLQVTQSIPKRPAQSPLFDQVLIKAMQLGASDVFPTCSFTLFACEFRTTKSPTTWSRAVFRTSSFPPPSRAPWTWSSSSRRPRAWPWWAPRPWPCPWWWPTA